MEKIDTEKTKMDKLIRDFENTKYFGYMFFVEYDGQKFESFDENPNKKSVKSEFRKILENNKIKIFKGIQQAGRTDANVSAKENILYINSKNIIDFSKLKFLETEGMKINKIVKTLPFLEFPQMIEKRYYIYEYPENLVKNNEERISQICEKVSGKRDFYEFTSEKGKKLKNHIREVLVKYENGKLYFAGDGFLPQQVRIMSSYILNNSKKPLNGEYLTLEKVGFSDKLKNLVLMKIDKINDLEEYSEELLLDEIENIKKIKWIDKNNYFLIFYVNRRDKGEFIGKRGKNIKKYKRIFGNIIIKEI